jgi:hypothetical protein
MTWKTPAYDRETEELLLQGLRGSTGADGNTH